MQIGNHHSYQSLLVTNIGQQDIILGMSFLKEHNSEIDWKKGDLQFSQCPEICIPHHDEDLDSLEIPHLENFEANFLEIPTKGDRWNNLNCFLQWVSWSTDPKVQNVAMQIMGLNTKRNSFGTTTDKEAQDKGYWSTTSLSWL